MPRVRSLRTLGFVALALWFGSCTIRLADLNAISTRNVNLDRVDLDKLPGKKVEGKSSAFVFLFIPFGFPTLQEAVDDALDKGGGDLVTDVAVYRSAWWFLVGMETMTVKGTVVNTKGGSR
ncbi:MAG: hypothetical protein KDC87_02175 [Planctomycetes bacterium]|nr:hypothetical protein [Planctomycetota bacterium]